MTSYHTYTVLMVSAHVCSSLIRFVGIITGIREIAVCSRDRPGYGGTREAGLKHVSTHV